MTNQITEKRSGEWVEIEPGEWFFFWDMPLSDDEVIERYRSLSGEITRLSAEIRSLEAEFDKTESRRAKIVGDWMVNHAETYVNGRGRLVTKLADGRDVLKVAPKTTQKVADLKRQILQAERQFNTYHKERSDLAAWYPATLIRAGLMK